MKSREATIMYCKAKYNDKTFRHCEAVASYAESNPCTTTENADVIFKIAMCHDLLEDTNATLEEICQVTGLEKDFAEKVLGLLTKGYDENYSAYIKRLRETQNPYAYIVKIADMKDHLLRTDTLTDKLRAKYWAALPDLL